MADSFLTCLSSVLVARIFGMKRGETPFSEWPGEAQRIIASKGLAGPGEIYPSMQFLQIDPATARWR